MTITLGDSDSALYDDGVPKLVIVTIVYDDGHRQQIPYPADRPIRQLYQDLRRVRPSKAQLEYLDPVPTVESVGAPGMAVLSGPVPRLSGEIARGDTVRGVRTLSTEEGDLGIEAGREYGVLAVRKERGTIIGYELIDHAAPVRERVPVPADAVELVRKAARKAPKVAVFEQTRRCVCGEDMILTKQGGAYSGRCLTCQREHLEDPA